MLDVMDKIICLGKNYADHIAEMKEKAPELPVLFIKPPSVFQEVKNNGSIILPWERGTIHHEVEVVFKLYKKNIIGLGLGLDLTLRDTQKELKAKGHPWEISKVFKNSALCSQIYGVRDFLNWQETPFTLKINGEIRQESKLSNALMKPNDMIHYIDKYFPLCDGDLIYTGTPSGVGPLQPEDLVELRFGPVETSFRLLAKYE
jgi:2-keto-4-pentenoate hydratase/2-oxohepta-3-ene-1,7-dioic acid hydratase in catechol pathway